MEVHVVTNNIFEGGHTLEVSPVADFDAIQAENLVFLRSEVFDYIFEE